MAGTVNVSRLLDVRPSGGFQVAVVGLRAGVALLGGVLAGRRQRPAGGSLA